MQLEALRSAAPELFASHLVPNAATPVKPTAATKNETGGNIAIINQITTAFAASFHPVSRNTFKALAITDCLY